MSTPAVVSSPPPAPLFAALREQPRLLLLELAWRWLCGGFLLLLAGYDGWRIWAHSLPQLRALGLLNLSAGSLLEDPWQALSLLNQAGALLRPQIDHAVWGLAPFGIFAWVTAFALGRSAVLAHFNPLLPRRPWLMAQGEAIRILGLLASGLLWSALAESTFNRFTSEAPVLPALIPLLLVTAAVLLLSDPVRRSIQIAMMLALVENRSFSSVWKRAWSYHRTPAVQPLRHAVTRVRRLLFLLALALTVVPAPFPFGPLLIAWWFLLTLPSLAAADAWRLSALLAVLRTVQLAEPDASRKPNP